MLEAHFFSGLLSCSFCGVSFINLLLWFAVSIYFLALIPQIITNYKLKSTEGLSDVFIICYTLTYVFSMSYYFCLDFSLPHKIIEPISFMLVIILVFQRIYYSPAAQRIWLYPPLVACGALGLFFFSWAQISPFEAQRAGHLAGYLMAIFDTITPIPQIIQINRTKSVEGLSFLFTTCIALANTSELIACIVQNFPPQTFFMGVKAIVFYLIFVVQFMLYKNNSYSAQDVSAD